MSPYVIAVLRAIHVLSASFWFGANVVGGFFLIPSLRAAGPAGGQVSRQIIQVRRMPLFVGLAVPLVLVTGGFLLWNVSGGFSAAFFGSRFGVLLSIGIAAALVAAVLGLAVIPATTAKLGRVAAEAQAAGGPPSPETVAEMGRLQDRFERATRLGALLTAIAAILMASARYW